ncbi:methylmalonyl Co-A mutase-associated GTPase MeaB [Paucihalobacter sp.]|uniref:methylmalonyl Co-A mutase-associated GTPase MeaB n=1 Tax=Paucihalobacter sp. TaxID=2850405 RepID=UPI002FE30E55
MSSKKHKALSEKKGVKQPSTISSNASEFIKKRNDKQTSSEELISNILKGNITALSQAITLVESTQPEHTKKAHDIILGCLPHANKSVRIGITGIPGVGKSTFIEALGLHLVNQERKVAVLAVDPSSSLSKGSILGDKTRMENLVKSDQAFIRPSASGSSLGGVARKTRESIILCEAGGYNTILVETVGVGQSETAVHGMVDFFLLLKIAGAGDELQGIKRGIIEMADAIVINKADGDNIQKAKNAKVEFNRALHLYPAKDSGWTPTVSLCSALEQTGINDLWELIEGYLKQVKENGYFRANRIQQNKHWLTQTIDDRLKSDFYNKPQIKLELKQQMQLIEQGKTTPFVAADYLLNL